ncbi:glycosyl hydrolase [Herbivorax sp. ANBcel31]|uniref:glycosyl hydrolase n=1 Tax=Herbivorax sp. ANBcel31 TaxID=3069754 RepID=UPI0027B37F9E|nr:glycosyl hydrolase [Herbivorax sp. ANBcel31]MDQ2086444.1 glycosyl hydrolase [Herbivorax sp. ANBcel31]
MFKKINAIICILVMFCTTSLFLQNNVSAFEGEVKVGEGSYSTVLPSGAENAQSTIYRTGNVKGPMSTNDWWSSTAFLQYSERQHPHPLGMINKEEGIQVYYPGSSIFANENAIAGWMNLPEDTSDDFTIGHSSVNAFPDTKVDSYSDWFVTNLFSSGSNSMRVTYGSGSPYLYFDYAGGNPKLTFGRAPYIWSGDANSKVLGITINERHYGLFGPEGSTWSGIGTTTLTNNLGNSDYFSVALLPDNSQETLSKFTQYAYSHVTDTKADFVYNEDRGEVVTTFTYTTEVKEGSETGTLFALYPHQWRHTDSDLLNYSYETVKGEMRLGKGNGFQTKMKYTGVLPTLPDLGTYEKERLNNYINSEAGNTPNLAVDTYNVGKELGKAAVLAPIAEQLGNTEALNAFHNRIKQGLETWFTASDYHGNLKDSTVFYYNDIWGTMIGYQDSHGSGPLINDHHFHFGYYVKAAAEIARLDSNWASQSNWGGMVELLISDFAGGRDDDLFPYLRNFDSYSGHSWASGNANFGDGNNQESSSEAMNAWTAMILWGEATGNTEIRDRGIYLYTTEMHAINEYWFDVHQSNFHSDYPHDQIAMVWGGKLVNGTWWSENPEEIHGINWLPLHGGSLYLGHYPEYVDRNYTDLLNRRQSTDWLLWDDLIWMYRAMSNPSDAINQMNAGIDDDSNWLEAGNTKAHTYHWIHNFNAVGNVDRDVTSNHPVYAVFNKDGERTYVAYNYNDSPVTVLFSDGKAIKVEANSMAALTAEEAMNWEQRPIPECTSPPPRPERPVPVPVVTPTPPVAEGLVIDDFDSSSQWDSGKNDLGEDIVINGGIYNLEANTNLYFFYDGGNSPESFDTYINRDISSYSHLVLNIKGGSGGEETSLDIILNDGTDRGVPLSDYGSLTTDYKDIKIPLSDFGADLTNINYLRFEGTGTAKVIRINEIKTGALESDFIYGDINGDGEVDSNDYILLSRYLLEITDSFPTAFGEQAADLNGDGTIDSTDATILKRYLLEIMNEFPVEN